MGKKGTVGDKMEKNEKIKEKVNELKELLSIVGWSKKDLAKEVADERSRIGKPIEECDENKEYEKIKKLFTRSPRKTDKLDYYIRFIIEHRDNKKYNFIRLPAIDLSKFNEKEQQILKSIAKISSSNFS